MKIDFEKIYLQESTGSNPVWQRSTEQILARFPQAEVAPVESHWQIEDLFGADPADWKERVRKFVLCSAEHNTNFLTRSSGESDTICLMPDSS